MSSSLILDNGKLLGEEDAHSWWMLFAFFEPEASATVPAIEGRKWEASFLRRDSGGDILVSCSSRRVVRI